MCHNNLHSCISIPYPKLTRSHLQPAHNLRSLYSQAFLQINRPESPISNNPITIHRYKYPPPLLPFLFPSTLPFSSSLSRHAIKQVRSTTKQQRSAKMLGIFQKAFAHPPEELHSPVSSQKPKLPKDALADFLSSHPPDSTQTVSFGDSGTLAYSTAAPRNPLQRLLLVGYEDVYCLFKGSLSNLCPLINQYGLSHKSTNEAMLVVEAYRTLRDRGPYPADQVMKDLDGTFAFIMYDATAATVFTAMSSDGGVKLYWGLAADGSAIFSDEIDFVKRVCAKSFSPFPNGCMFHSEGGLMSYEHPMYKMRAMPRVDSEGAVCGAYFKVDVYNRIQSMPRVGSSSNWTEWDTHADTHS